MSDFYVTLHSGAKSDSYEPNKISNFRNKLSVPIKLEHGYFQVALVECSYIHSSMVVDKGEYLMSIRQKWIQNGKDQKFFHKVFASRSVYSIDDLLEVLNNQMFGITFRVNKERYVEVLCLRQFIYKVIFSEKLAAILGLETEYLNSAKDVSADYEEENEVLEDPLDVNNYYQATNKIQLRAGQTRIFVYTDIIKPQYVGDTMVPLLRSFMESELAPGSYVTKSFDHLEYLDLIVPEFETIHVYLKNESGEAVLLESGTCSVTLHFRRKRY